MKNKIIEAASELFATKGYQNTTVRDICKKAGVYQLSINYHFGSKENLFKEVLLKTYEDTEETILMEKIKDFPPEKQLEEIIRTRLKSIFNRDKKGRIFKIAAKEFSNNYEFMVEIMSTTLLKYLTYIKSIFAKLSENKLNDFELNYCVYLLMSHLSALSVHEKAVLVLFNTKNPDDEQLEQFVQHVKKFILAGVEKLREEAR
ncbi:MAG: hypothetical protein A2Y25_09955 [Candidatus Melainabacteria bacterium GWF2_37_15]|nr:MAG: hypothetical protein A2Y25_09955 [Candidatus Melainabacteria bacterium GWF2_37_15]